MDILSELILVALYQHFVCTVLVTPRNVRIEQRPAILAAMEEIDNDIKDMLGRNAKLQ